MWVFFVHVMPHKLLWITFKHTLTLLKHLFIFHSVLWYFSLLIAALSESHSSEPLFEVYDSRSNLLRASAPWVNDCRKGLLGIMWNRWMSFIKHVVLNISLSAISIKEINVSINSTSLLYVICHHGFQVGVTYYNACCLLVLNIGLWSGFCGVGVVWRR